MYINSAMKKICQDILFWGRFDPNYSRNRILRQALGDLGWTIFDFCPRVCPLGDAEAWLRGLPKPGLVWVPCFRQRDMAAARRWCRLRKVPLLFDPLISAYDKQVFERCKFAPDSAAAERVRRKEALQFQAADVLLADTRSHASFYAGTFGVPPSRIHVVPVGAEEPLFGPGDERLRNTDGEFKVLFYGSFIALHGVETIADATRLYEGPPVRWLFLGDGPARAACEQATKGLANVVFEDWNPYTERPKTIWGSDLVLGVFGTSAKAERVIANKVFQALACGRPVLTRESSAYPDAAKTSSGLIQVPPGDPRALAQAVTALARDRGGMAARNRAARELFETHFSRAKIAEALKPALEACEGCHPGRE